MADDKFHIPDDLKARAWLIETAVKKRCRSLQVKTEEQHIEITGHAGRLEKDEKEALRSLGLSHSTYGTKLYKDQYESVIKSLIKRGFITSPR